MVATPTKAASQERPGRSANGFVCLLVGAGIAVAGLLQMLALPSPQTMGILVLAGVIALFMWLGLYVLQPNQAALLQLFGSYRGTDRSEGLRWANPFYAKTKVSVRAHNFNSERIKVNDLRGNPIEIAATVVWRIEDTARASFDVENYEGYVLTQAEAAIRHLASSYAYDNLDDTLLPPDVKRELTLRSSTDEVGVALRSELHDRFSQAGIVVVDAKLTHLAYAPEIAGTMLRRQQAEAIVSARAKIVQGAVGMVELALNSLQERGLVSLEDDRKAQLVSNLLVVLCSDHDATPVVNMGSNGR